jgi:hypothetical protein
VLVPDGQVAGDCHMSIFESVPRAPRSALDVPVHVRRIGATGWEPGQAVNISRSGLLIEVRGSFRCHDTIDAIVELSRATSGIGDIRLRGRVARMAQADSLTQLGTTIDEYRLQPANASDPSHVPEATDDTDDCLIR